MIRQIPNLNILDSLVPISRFNRGEANKVFDEVKASGYKIVVKNNVPEGIIISPEVYKDIMDEIEDNRLLELAARRMRNDSDKAYSLEFVKNELGITDDDLTNVEVEID
ncbi:MAG: type II toxin-antitoxin system Phd/YefM family antitoxin [Clostridiales bacterium]|jgi:PHD/YefM family antitoxin component YafN of YafNO toxin-antitoxin module|nr:type II toxin-antitoxin system Phd/YefM family antitoxin [Clostridiales bacterium]